VNLKSQARTLRSQQTEAEQHLWYRLRGHRFIGINFKRQKPIGPYIVDFVCVSVKLVVEVDGGHHNKRETHDANRSRWLEAEGFTVLRFWNHEVLQQTEAVLEKIRLTIEQQQPLSPTPLPQAGEGKLMS